MIVMNYPHVYDFVLSIRMGYKFYTSEKITLKAVRLFSPFLPKN